MANAVDIQGVVFKGGSCTLLARVVGPDAQPILQGDIASAAYTVYLLDDADPDAQAPVDGHEDVSLAVADCIYDELQTDACWTADGDDVIGYNFRHTLDVASEAAFATAGRHYRVVVALVPYAGQVILVRFRVRAI